MVRHDDYLELIRRRLDAIVLRAPSVFSMFDRPDAAVPFINSLLSCRTGQRVFIDLSKVSRMSADAALCLMAAAREHRGLVRGNLPRDRKTLEILRELGFVALLRMDVPQLGLTSLTNRGFMQQRSKAGARVEPDFAQRCAEMATLNTTRQGSDRHTYRLLIECMSNTHNHAGTGGRQAPWWVCVHSPAPGRVVYCFVDLGVGIVASAKARNLMDAALHALDSPADALKAIALGAHGSRTRKSERGRGLPGMVEVCRKGSVRDLKLLANSGMWSVSDDRKHVVAESFPGTLVRWEVTS